MIGLVLLFVLALSGLATSPDDAREVPAAPSAARTASADAPAAHVSDPAAFLDALVGEWAVETQAVLGPGQEPVRSESRAVARRVGRWVVVESTGATPTGQAYTSIRTLGHDPARGEFVGTWIDSMQSHLWLHAGSLDEAGKVLMLEMEGPIMGDASRTARYREYIEAPAADRTLVRSQILGPDGEWFEFGRAEYRRLR